MSATRAEILGFLEQLIQLMQDSKADLSEQGLDVTNRITNLTAKQSDVVKKIGEQDKLEASLRAKTKEVQNAETLAYDAASTDLDAIIGVLGKKTPLAKQAAKLRSSINKQSKSKTTAKKDPE